MYNLITGIRFVNLIHSRKGKTGEKQHETKAIIGIPIAGVVPVPIRAAQIPGIPIPGTTTQNTRPFLSCP